MSAHDPARRAEATADPRILRTQRLDLAACGEGKASGGKWTRVRGPHLKSIRSRGAKNRTGCPGISYGANNTRRSDGSIRTRHYFVVQLGKTSRKFCIESLGRHEAFRRALAVRAAHEIKVREANAAILRARESNQ